MDIEKILNQMPQDGFLKVSARGRKDLSPADKVKLIRKANVFFNENRVEDARRIYTTVHNTDGLIRVGDYYRDQNRPFEAIKMYRMAPAPDRMEEMVYKMARVLQHWLGDKNEETGTE